MPGNGSSSRRKLGSRTSERAIYTPPFAARKHVALAVAYGFKAKLRDQAHHPLPALAAADGQGLENRHQVVFHG